jgi:hypothetical protein
MKFNDAYRGSFIKTADLNGKARRLTIASIGQEELGGEQKIVIRFQEDDRGFVANKTNGLFLKEAFGEELDDWVGNSVVLRPDKTDFQGKRVDCIRISLPPRKPPVPVVNTEEEDDAEVNV